MGRRRREFTSVADENYDEKFIRIRGFVEFRREKGQEREKEREGFLKIFSGNERIFQRGNDTKNVREGTRLLILDFIPIGGI